MRGSLLKMSAEKGLLKNTDAGLLAEKKWFTTEALCGIIPFAQKVRV